nr:hypothetical protein GCM10017745_41620 [Saccharothrix mutabilis subsp. capreolus]
MLQFWHHVEHLLLILQSSTGVNLLGRPVPTSIVQLLVPRVELHLFYNFIVFVPMVVAMVLHMRPNGRNARRCGAPAPCPRWPDRCTATAAGRSGCPWASPCCGSSSSSP